MVLNAAQTFTATQTVRAAPTQDGVALAGRAGGTSSYAATFTPTTLSANRTLTIPDASGTILQSGTAVTVAQGGTGATTLTGVLKGNGTSAFTASNVSLSSEVTGTLPVANGGTGAATLTANNVILGNGTSAVQFVAPGANGNVLTSNGTTWVSSAAGASGTVTSVAMTVPAFLSVSGSPITSSGTLAVSYSGTALPVANGGTGATTLTGVLKGNGTSAFSAATAGTDYVAPATATTFTALQTFSGSTSVAATKLANAKEVATISATAATGTIAYDVTTQSVLYYTSNASANWTVNFRGSSGTSLDTLMSTGESITAAFLVTQGSTAYYNSAVQVDGSSVTPKYQGGTAWSAGNASSIDAYVYTIVKTGSAAFTVFASQTRFA